MAEKIKRDPEIKRKLICFTFYLFAGSSPGTHISGHLNLCINPLSRVPLLVPYICSDQEDAWSSQSFDETHERGKGRNAFIL